MRKKRILSEEHKRKIGESSRGKKHPPLSEESLVRIREAAAKRRGRKTGPRPDWVKKKISEATTGVKKTITGPNSGWFPKGQAPKCGFKKGHTLGKGRKLSPETIEKTASKIRGRKATLETREKLSAAQLRRREKRPEPDKRRNWKHKEWSSAVKERDGNKCTICGNTEHLHTHHIKTWKTYPELRYELSNGITYCRSCHNKQEWANRERIPWNKGRAATEEERKRLCDMAKGRVAWNKGKKAPGSVNSGSFKKGLIPWNKK